MTTGQQLITINKPIHKWLWNIEMLQVIVTIYNGIPSQITITQISNAVKLKFEQRSPQKHSQIDWFYRTHIINRTLKFERHNDLFVDATTTTWGTNVGEGLFESIRVKSWDARRTSCSRLHLNQMKFSDTPIFLESRKPLRCLQTQILLHPYYPQTRQ